MVLTKEQCREAFAQYNPKEMGKELLTHYLANTDKGFVRVRLADDNGINCALEELGVTE